MAIPVPPLQFLYADVIHVVSSKRNIRYDVRSVHYCAILRNWAGHDTKVRDLDHSALGHGLEDKFDSNFLVCFAGVLILYEHAHSVTLYARRMHSIMGRALHMQKKL